MKFKPTILNVPAGIFLIACLVYTVINYSTLSYAEGWGVVFMVGVIAFGITAFIVDLIIQNVIKSSGMRLLFRIAALIAYFIFFFLGLKGA